MYDKVPSQRNSVQSSGVDHQPIIANYDYINDTTKKQIEKFHEDTEFAVEDEDRDVNYWIYGTKKTLAYFIDQTKKLNPDKKILVIKDYANNERWLSDSLIQQVTSNQIDLNLYDIIILDNVISIVKTIPDNPYPRFIHDWDQSLHNRDLKKNLRINKNFLFLTLLEFDEMDRRIFKRLGHGHSDVSKPRTYLNNIDDYISKLMY